MSWVHVPDEWVDELKFEAGAGCWVLDGGACFLNLESPDRMST